MNNSQSEQNSKNIIITEAIKLIAEKGFNELKYLDLSKRAHISTVTLRKYFKTKNDILAAIFCSTWEHIMRVVNDKIQELIGADEVTLIEKIFSLTVAYLLADENKDIAFVLLFESRQVGVINKVIYPHAVEVFVQLLRNLIKSAQDKRIFSKDLCPEEIETIIWAVGEECLYRNYLHKYQKELGFEEQVTKRAVDYSTIEKPLKLLEKVLKVFKGETKKK